MKTELKPCPFCGGEATLRELYDGWRYVICDNPCNIMPSTTKHASEEEAIQAWNTRAVVPERTTSRTSKFKTKYGRKVPLCEWCGYSIGDSRYKFCPNCGAMVVK